MNSNEKGNVGEAVVIAEATKHDYTVLIPIGEHGQYDLVLEKNGHFTKIQVKYAEIRKGIIRVRNYHNAGKGNQTRKYKDTEIDALIVYNKETDKCYFIPFASFKGQKYLALRFEPPKKKKDITWAKDFEW
jgi:hypothetical protein